MNEEFNRKFFSWAEKLRDISAFGLTFCKNKYDIENYEKIQKIAVDMTASLLNLEVDDLEPIRRSIISRPTPLVNTDAAIMDSHQLLMIKRADNGEWAFPGGYLDIGETPAISVIREAKEEVGIDVKPIKLIGIYDTRRLRLAPFNQAITLLFLCEPINNINRNLTAHNKNEVRSIHWLEENQLSKYKKEMDPYIYNHALNAFNSLKDDYVTYFDF